MTLAGVGGMLWAGLECKHSLAQPLKTQARLGMHQPSGGVRLVTCKLFAWEVGEA